MKTRKIKKHPNEDKSVLKKVSKAIDKIKSRYSSEQLIDFCQEEVTLYCTNCKESQTEHNVDSNWGSEIFFEKGWRGTENNCYCPKCAKKKLKNI